MRSIGNMALGSVCWCLAALIVLSVANLSKVFPHWGSYLVIPAGIGFLTFVSLGRALINTGRRGFATARRDVKTRDKRRPVLYLRGFDDDAEGRATEDSGGMPFAPLTTVEEQLARAVSFIGPMIAIGRPGEDLPELGAARSYVAHSRWKAEVTRMIEESAVVLIRLGITAGVRWELDTAFKHKKPREIVLLVPFDKAEYEGYRASVPSPTRRRLPPWEPGHVASLPISALITFDDCGVGTFEPIRPDERYDNRLERLMPPLRLALRQVGQNVGARWSPPPTAAVYTIRFLAQMVLLAAIVGLIVITCGSPSERALPNPTGSATSPR